MSQPALRERYTPQKSFQQLTPDTERAWFLVDAEQEILGRMATRVARVLMGKHKPTYTPHTDTGDFVVVVNAEKVRVTGKKRLGKLYHYHTGYFGGLRTHNLAWMIEHHPDQVIRLAVKRMLPKSKLGRRMLKKLKVYSGPDHQHQAQNPTAIQFTGK